MIGVVLLPEDFVNIDQHILQVIDPECKIGLWFSCAIVRLSL